MAGVFIPDDDRTPAPVMGASTTTVRASGVDLGTGTNTRDCTIGLRGGGLPRVELPRILNRLSRKKEMWLEAAESIVEIMDLATPTLLRVWRVFRALFGLSLLFYGMEFATLAFHVIVFRLSGWKKVCYRMLRVRSSPSMRHGK